jgi:hypothetical protein
VGVAASVLQIAGCRRTGRSRCTYYLVLAVPLRSIEIDRFAVNAFSSSTERGQGACFWVDYWTEGVSSVQRPEDSATLSWFLWRWI